MDEKLEMKSKLLNKFLEGGLEKGIITTVYGPPGSGKTNIAMMAAISAAKQGMKVIYIDTEGGVSMERFRQLLNNKIELLENIFFLKPANFKEQKKAFEKMKTLLNGVGLIVVDTISMLYRIELGTTKDIYETNKTLGLQLNYLTEIARKKKIPVIVTNQVYADFENPSNVKMVGGDILKYASKCLIEIKKYKNKRELIIVKHRSIKEGKNVFFRILNKGLAKPKE